MGDASQFRVSEVRVFERGVELRLPFRFGAVTLTACPQAFVRVRVTFGTGAGATGASAELLVPKWFDKAASKSDAQNIEELRSSLRAAAAAYTSDRTARTAFGHSAAHYRPLIDAAAKRGTNALTACYGPALIDRAILDAVCRHRRISFHVAMRANVPAIDAGTLAPDLHDFDLAGFLAQLEPRPSVAARHTVGMLDAITAADRVARVDDGLPESLEEVIEVYGHRYFKVKLRGELASDVERLTAVAAVLDRMSDGYFVTLDGNEQYTEPDGIESLWQSISGRPLLSRFSRSVMWIEQPLSRDGAQHASVAALADLKPVLIDESDGTIEAFAEARRLGYSGVSSKSCKGLYKSVLNAARCAQWNEAGGDRRYFMSAEDLTMQAGLAVQQDLALVSLLGLTHSERNGHHYVNGFAGAGAGEAEQQRFLSAHPDLYERSHGSVRLGIRGGVIALGSLDQAGFASGAEPDWDSLDSMGR
jgi:hypothetical protein